MDKIKYTTYTKPEHKSWVVFIHGAGGSCKTFGRQIAAFRKHFNLLLPDLRDHGASKDMDKILEEDFSIDLVAKDVLEVMNSLGIESAHFVGVSLGSIVIRTIEIIEPAKVLSIVTGGGVLRFNKRTSILFSLAVFASKFIPYQTLYAIVAWILMPKSNHKAARRLFKREAINVNNRAFKTWLNIVDRLKVKMNEMFYRSISAPILMIMGDEDYAFLEDSKLMKILFPDNKLSIIPSCGHLCNLEKPIEFNKYTIDFILSVDMKRGEIA